MLTKIFKSGNSLAVRIPREMGPEEGAAEIERVGDHWLIRPVKAAEWPPGFFESIRLADPESFTRPEQGEHREIEL